MDEYGPTASPQHAGASRRLLRRLEQYEDEPRMTPGEMRIAAAVERTVDERLADGLLAIEEQATALMREIAGEIWRSGGADARPEQERIVSLLSRDQTIKGLLNSSDERFQALALRSARLEDSLTDLTESGRATRASMEASVAAIREIADSPTLHGVEGVRSQLEQVEHHIAAAFEHFDERDRVLTEDVLGQIKAHGELVARETTRLVEVMQQYVQTGAEAMAILAHPHRGAGRRLRDAGPDDLRTRGRHGGGPDPARRRAARAAGREGRAARARSKIRCVRRSSGWSRPASWVWPS